MFCMTRAQQIEGGKQLSNEQNENNKAEMRNEKWEIRKMHNNRLIKGGCHNDSEDAIS